jgi:ribonuclease G
MSTELIINASLPETRIALMESGEIQDLLIERAQGKGIVGNIYKGRVTRVLPGMQAAFVDIGLEKAAFLYVDDVFVHGEVFEEEEDEKQQSSGRKVLAEVGKKIQITSRTVPTGEGEASASEGVDAGAVSEAKADALGESELEAEDLESLDRSEGSQGSEGESQEDSPDSGDSEGSQGSEEDLEEDYDFTDSNEDDEDSEEDEDHEPTEMSADGEGGNDDKPSSNHPGTVSQNHQDSGSGSDDLAGGQAGAPGEGGRDEGPGGARRGRHRRGRRGGKFRRRTPAEGGDQAEGGKGPQIKQAQGQNQGEDGDYPSNLAGDDSDEGSGESDRSAMVGEGQGSTIDGEGRPEGSSEGNNSEGRRILPADKKGFKSQRNSERRVPSRSGRKPPRAQVNIQDLLKEGQEVLVQVAKDPISTKGARLTCHISLPGRHLVCMPTIDHVGVSRRIERDEERRRLREIVERNRPRNLGFIVRTASGKGQAEKRITQDINYLSRLWDEIREKSANTTAPALVYEDLNSVLRAIRDWVTDDIDKIIVDSRYHYNEIQRFVSHFMPSLKQKVELYHGDIPIFDAYNISTELSRALERKVWLKSGGYIVVDQAEALVAIDVNTGRYVGKKNLEDTILKTNLEAVQEIAYQLRLRNCGGIIILDLIDMEREENKQRVYRALEEALKRDRARPSILKISELGLIEMTRKRTRDTIVRALCESCTHCEGKGFVKSKTTVAYEILREIEREGIEKDVTKILVQAHPDAIDILAIDERETLDQIERRYRKTIYLQAVTDSHIEQFEVVGDKKPGKTAGEFSEVVQSYRTHTSPERGGDRERNDRGGRGGGRDRGGRGGRDRNRDQNRDQNREGRDEKSAQGGGQGGAQGSERPAPRQIQIPRPNPHPIITASADAGQSGGSSGPGGDDAQPHFTPGPQIIIGGTGSSGGEGNENFGNRAPSEGGNAGGPVAPRDGDDFYDEEDRLAFLRAQAAQDAALARFRNSGESSPSQNQGNGRGGGGGGGRSGGGRNDNNRNRNSRGRRGGGKFGGRDQGQGGQGQNRNDNRNRGPRPAGQFGGRGPQPGNGPQSAGPSDSGAGNSSGGGNDSGGGSDTGGGGGGAGDSSQPPV